MNKICVKVFVCFAGLFRFDSVSKYATASAASQSLLDRLTHPFDQRIRYRIAEVDPRFGLNEHELKQISQQIRIFGNRV